MLRPFPKHRPWPIRHCPAMKPHLDRLLNVCRLWLRRSRTRRALTALDVRLLDDIGLTAGERRAECAKRFWRA